RSVAVRLDQRRRHGPVHIGCGRDRQPCLERAEVLATGQRMAVYTEVSLDEAAPLLQSLGLGQLQTITPCAGGIENTNYFVDTDQGRYVLTLFERLSFELLPFYLYLMQHLA